MKMDILKFLEAHARTYWRNIYKSFRELRVYQTKIMSIDMLTTSLRFEILAVIDTLNNALKTLITLNEFIPILKTTEEPINQEDYWGE